MSYDHTFTYPDHLSTFPKETQRILTMANELGWQTRWLGQKHDLACIMAPDGSGYSINVPRTNINHNRMKSWTNQINRHSDPDRVADYLDKQTLVTGKTPGQRLAMPGPVSQRTIVARETAVAKAMREAAEAAAQAEDERIIRDANDDDEQVAALVAEEKVSRVSGQSVQYRDGDTSVHLVSESPWMVRKDGIDGAQGRMYESHSVIHRVWSDGSEDYRCRFCGRVNDNPRSIAVHAAKSSDTTHPPAPTHPTYRRVESYEQTEIKHSDSTVRRLTSDLLHALDAVEGWQSMTREELARALAVSVHEARPDRAPAEPLTPEQVIARIVLLVDSGRLAEMHQQVERMAAALVEATDARNRLTDEVIAAQHEAERLREERRALAAMLSDEAS